MEKAHNLHKRLKLDDPPRDAWVCIFPAAHKPPTSHRHFFRSQTFVAAPTRETTGLHSNHYDHLENGDQTEHRHLDDLHKEYSETDSQTTLCAHPHRPFALSYPGNSGAPSNLHHTNGKTTHVEHRQLWDFTRSKTEYIHKSAIMRDCEELTSGVGSSASSSDADADGLLPTPTGAHPKKHRRMDILQLCEHLKTHGLGEPLMSTSSHVPRTQNLPPGVKARRLPRDPSTREKIKGRARLDYELANLRAAAFCEQQHPRTFRTASANFRNRDVRLLEEEEREQVQRDLQENGGEGHLDPDDEDASSLVGSPLSREELFTRIEAWADDVDKALHPGHH